jgi:16S rRNA (guanine527-N7)-methyltransferase
MMDIFREGAARLGFSPTPRQIEQFETYYRELVDWNGRVNLTAITGYEEVQLKHFVDSLTVATCVAPPDATHELTVIDVGTGAGLPGIPLKIMWPQISLTLLEATGKKTLFLNHLLGRLGLQGVDVVTGRAEDKAHLEGYRERFDLVLARGVAPLPALLELTLPFCSVGGAFIAQKQIEAKPEIEQASRATAVLGGQLKEVRDIRLPGLTPRSLVVYGKVRPTPAEYPRRPGTPAKKPL